SDVGHVGDDRGGAGAERVVLDERRRHRLAADDEEAVLVGDQRGVVAVSREGSDELEVALAEQSWGIAHGGDEIGHRRHSSVNVLRQVEAVNLGLSTFADALRAQGASVVEVDWRPPAGGDASVVELLTRLWGRHGDAIAEANARAVSAIEGSVPLA